jgi:hypothetical protein
MHSENGLHCLLLNDSKNVVEAIKGIFMLTGNKLITPPFWRLFKMALWETGFEPLKNDEFGGGSRRSYLRLFTKKQTIVYHKQLSKEYSHNKIKKKNLMLS